MGIDARQNPRSKEYSGPDTVLDARGRVLQPGDEVIVSGPGPLYFRVVEITPLLDPKLPPGLLHIAFGAVLHFSAQRQRINPEFVRVRTAEEAGPLPMRGIDEEQRAEAPPASSDLQIVKSE